MKDAVTLAVLSIFIPLAGTATVHALSEEQRQVIDSGAEYFNIEQDACAGNSNLLTPPEGEVPAGSRAYVLGDSITNQSRSQIETEFSLSELELLSINADPGRAISVDTAGNDPTGLEAIATDAGIIAEANVVVVALGTNSGTEDLNVQVPSLVTSIRTINPDALIFWVDLFYATGGNDERNAVINTRASTSGYRVINTTSAGIELGSDNIHPTAAGSTTFAKTIAAGVRSGGSVSIDSPPSSAGYDALSMTFPAFPSETTIASTITDYLRERHANTPWFTIDSDFGTWLVRESKTRNINPLLILAVGRQENAFGTSGGSHVTRYYNYFGMKGSGPVQTGGSYKGFSSATEGILFFMDKVKTNTQGPDRGLYVNVVNIYDYQSLHQSGIIAYPGEPLDPNDQLGPGGRPDGDRLNGWDEAMKVYMSWDVNKNDGPPAAEQYRGNTYNPGIYYKNTVGLINRITGLTLSEIPARGGSGIIFTCVGGAAGGTGKVSGSGYSFPLAPQTRAVSGIEIGQTTTKHHDSTPAFDLFSTDSADVFALYSGVATVVSTDYKGIPGCSTIQFKADDGFYYWYGHLKNPTIQEGTPVKAGDKIAELADRANFGSDCWGGAPHLHIDRGCMLEGVPQTGGRDECRDPDFIPFLSSIYAELPNN